MELTTGTLIENRYEIKNLIGKGGMGNVYQALDRENETDVALKFILGSRKDDEVVFGRFKHEYEVLSLFDHKNIVKAYNFYPVSEPEPFFVQEYVRGRSLKDLIEESKESIEIKECLRILAAVLNGLKAIHAKGIIYRDLSPDNVLITGGGEEEGEGEGEVKLIDFGVAGKVNKESGKVETDLKAGNPSYMSPEQTRSEALNQRSDIFAFGILTYELLTGKHPFTGTSNEALFYAITTCEADLTSKYRKDVPFWLKLVLENCLKKNPEDRFKSVDEILFIFNGMRKFRGVVGRLRSCLPF